MKNKRKEFPLKTRLEAMARFMRCPVCKQRFGDLKNVHFDHDETDAMGGKNTVENCVPLCIACHSLKTNGKKHTSYGSDKHIIAKSKRLRGITKTRPKVKINSRGFSKVYRKKLNGEVEKR